MGFKRKRMISREIKELSLLFEISQKLSETLDLKKVLAPILQMMADHMEMLRGTLTILNRKTGEIFIEEAYGLMPEEQAKGKYLPGEGITGRVIDTGQPAIIPRISNEPLFLNRTGSRKNLNKEDISFICVPIKIGPEAIGALSVDRLFNKRISFEEDVRLLTIIASSISQAVRLRQLAEEELDKVREENSRLQNELRIKFAPKNIIGTSKAMLEVYDQINKVCQANTTVLILGESGVGKERVAHAIHYSSKRARGPYIAINCAALPESLIESELFGHEKGAFTGAIGIRKGRFEMAEKGTLFLDEIGELSLALQAKLLRVLQEKKYERVGGGMSLRADVRIIAATNRNLEELLQEGKFREDLYYRLNIFPIVVPPLRDRKTDIPLLADYFIEKYAREIGKEIVRISTPAIDLLMSYAWPGNVRELENCIERAILLSTDGVIQGYHLPPRLQREEISQGTKCRGAFKAMIAAYEQEILLEELQRCRGNMARAARALGMTERVMGLRIAKYGIDPGVFK
ncbi:Nif-specific regulatory protein [Syntrophus gentianae]|uniref:Nif-specific regulatory protein n=2 Tax=Syntrophus gentianae TaxID=43775 RepID=A0A1H7YUT2_9BACT|nr:Nif-specific regulatory protein [Syntrophus gentianae]